ncbi:PREDICTED: probable transcription factor At4g00390 [Nicotiana attenuata]|uniref:Mediator-associated protein 1 n=1 Tax=Nicotiana attenuata TaxID=49451 RepID=A0A1J6IQT5_NICAT|nr:PREDICTED: probable transcription factor At4g00390 [Nicotiana attenuata]OIT02912.1 mediator-associated protein 1 [Nicotiana attenuata]
MASLNLSKNEKIMQKMAKNHTDNPLKESDKDWTPTSSESISSESHSNSRKKRTMKNSGKKGASEAVNNFKRLWSDEDEIAVLEGMLEYASARNISPSVDYNAFYIFVKDQLQVEVSKNQLKDKVNNLKSKFMKNVAKRGAFSKPHEENLFKLSQRIWDDDNQIAKEKGATKVYDEVPKVGKKIAAKEKNNLCAGSSERYSSLVLYGGSAADLEDWFRQNPGLVSKEQRHEMLIKSHSMKIARAELQLNEITLMEEQVNLMTDAVKASQE